MMPILWRWLGGAFLRIATLCILAFVAMLLSMRFHDIAHFAALGAPPLLLATFILHQIPYILPIALPLACLIAAFILFQSLSQSHELTALRASGLSFFRLLVPVLGSAYALSLANFWITSEWATSSHSQANQLKRHIRSVNPLLLLQNRHLMRVKGFYFESFGDGRVGQMASQIILALPQGSDKGIALLVAQELHAHPTTLHLKEMTLLSPKPHEEQDKGEEVMVTQVADMEIPLSSLPELIDLKGESIRIADQSVTILLEALQQGDPLLFHKSLLELCRRLTLTLGVISFTLLGATCGIQLGRMRHMSSLGWVMGWSTGTLISFFAAQGISHHVWLAISLYLFPHFLICFFSYFRLKRLSQGRSSC